MKLESKFMIDGNVVEKTFSFYGIDVYVHDKCDDDVYVYFVKGSEVLATQRIEADCSQNCGFISEINFTKPKG